MPASDPFAHVAPTLDALRGRALPVRLLRIARPEPLVAFSRRDQRQPAFAAAVAAAEEAGFRAAVRPVGGTFAPMHEGSLVVDEFGWSSSGEWPDERFDRHARLLAGVFGSYGIDVRIGEVAGEYCPGAHSVNRGGTVKVSGTAQRVARGAWLVSSVVQVHDAARLRVVTRRVAAALAAPVEAATVGALADTVPGLSVAAVAARIEAAFVADGVQLTH